MSPTTILWLVSAPIARPRFSFGNLTSTITIDRGDALADTAERDVEFRRRSHAEERSYVNPISMEKSDGKRANRIRGVLRPR